VYIHLLAIVAGNSAYAFSLMLFAFLAGLGLGAWAGRSALARIARSRAACLFAVAVLQVGVGAAILVSLFAWNSIPDYFGSFYGFWLTASFASREVIRFVVCALFMLPTAAAIGASYPLTMHVLTESSPDGPLRSMGFGMLVNTVGNIVGALVGTFVLVPWLGSVQSLEVLILASFTLAGTCAFSAYHARTTGERDRPLPMGLAPALAFVLALLVAHPRSLDYNAMSTGANVYFASQPWGRVVDHAESVEGGLTTVTESMFNGTRRVLTLLTNGKFQGDDNPDGEMRAQLGFGLVPLLHTTDRGHALIIGLGTGVSARTVRDAGYREIDIAELSGDIVDLTRKHFGTPNRGVLDSPNVRTRVTDGRNHLLLSNEHYDLVSIEISSIWFAGAASLYNREFYELVKARLSGEGVLQQWMQLHRLSAADFKSILGTVHSVFPHVWLYMVGQQGQIIACAHACLPEERALDRIRATPTLQDGLGFFDGDPYKILGDRLLDTKAIEQFTASLSDVVGPVSTDDNSFLEYSTPKGNVRPYAESLQENTQLFAPFAPDRPYRSTRIRERMEPLAPPRSRGPENQSPENQSEPGSENPPDEPEDPPGLPLPIVPTEK
jgi:predicted membrane-bound spermidine synthase